MTTKEAIQHLSKELTSDEEYWYTWQANIACAFYDELAARGYRIPDQNEITNAAAKRFLENLIRHSKDEK